VLSRRFPQPPFYQTREGWRDPIGEADIGIVLELRTAAELIFVAGDLSDPYGPPHA
jgi:hypothetical protein